MRFLQVTRGRKLIWLAAQDSEARLWVYLPTTRMLHLNAGLYQDYYWDRELEYETVDAATALATIRRIDERPATGDSETLRRLAREPGMPLERALPDEAKEVLPERPWLADDREPLCCEFPALVAELRSVLGAKLVAFIAGVDETRTVRAWVDETSIPTPENIKTLRLTYRIVRRVERSGNVAIASWFQGMNPLLDDRSPARVLRVDHSDRAQSAVLAAADSLAGS